MHFTRINKIALAIDCSLTAKDGIGVKGGSTTDSNVGPAWYRG